MVVKTLSDTSEVARQEKVRVVSEAILDTFVAPCFPVASTGKWAKTGPAGDRLMLTNNCNVMEELTVRALSKLSFKFAIEADDKELDNSWAEWNKVAEKKSKTTKTLLHNPDKKASINAFQVVDESHRYLTQEHLHYAYREMTYEQGKPSPLQIMANDRRSPIYFALVNLSALLGGVSSRLVLIWRFRGCP